MITANWFLDVIARGSHFGGPQFTHWSALAVRRFWSAVYPLVGPQVRILPLSIQTYKMLHIKAETQATHLDAKGA